jgi:hypothetical protein
LAGEQRMTEETENMVLEMLRRIRGSQERTELDVADVKVRMFTLEQQQGQALTIQGQVLALQGQVVTLLGTLNKRMDRFDERLGRIERRLDMVEA